MEEVEVSARTVEQAVQLALSELGARLDEVEVTVLKEGKGGILGIGAEQAQVLVRRISQGPAELMHPAFLAIEVTEKLLAAMGLEATVAVRETPGDSSPLALEIKGEDLGIIIGRRGETLSSLQYMVNLIVGRMTKSRTFIVVDVEGYRKRREESLRSLAQRVAQRVSSTGQTITLEPMPPNERRIIHLALASYPRVFSQSIGEGNQRKVVVALRRG